MLTYQGRYRNITRNLRIIGVDDGAFPADKRLKQHALLVSVLFQNLHVRVLRLGLIQVDGRDANRVLASLLRTVRFDVVMLSGISFGGFNLIDIDELARVTCRPIIAIAGERPDNAAVRKALQTHFRDWKERWRMVRSAGELHSFKPLPEEPRMFFEVRGGSPSFARRAIASTAVISRLPEPIRVARILARELSHLAYPNLS